MYHTLHPEHLPTMPKIVVKTCHKYSIIHCIHNTLFEILVFNKLFTMEAEHQFEITIISVAILIWCPILNQHHEGRLTKSKL